jgi:threonylcarbamoyladenosine tRNA methylthiotransferase MtaB
MKVFLDTVGCKLNQSEIEKYSAQFHQAGHQIVARMDEADVVIVNTCAVTSAAAQDSRQKLRKAIHHNSEIQVIATGCLASLDEALDEVIPGLSSVVPNRQKDTLVSDLFGELPEMDYYQRHVVPGERHRTRAFIKVQDGCDNFCTFCITRIARGASRSIPAHQVIADIRGALAGNVKEVILTGVQLGSWGKEHLPPENLANLIEQILASTDERIRIRVSSLEPWDLTPEFFSLWRDPRLCPHFHLPIQSGTDVILRRMGRKTKTQEYSDLIGAIRKVLPDAAITTDVIVGFPGESEADFVETVEYVRSCRFAGGHVFSYSARAGTPAALYKDQVNGKIRHERSAELRKVFNDLGRQYRQEFLGKTEEVLWESSHREGDGYRLSGWTPHYIRVEAMSPEARRNHIQSVRIDTVTVAGCFGEII